MLPRPGSDKNLEEQFMFPNEAVADEDEKERRGEQHKHSRSARQVDDCSFITLSDF